jgi:cation transport regulator ChaC
MSWYRPTVWENVVKILKRIRCFLRGYHRGFYHYSVGAYCLDCDWTGEEA